MGVAAHTRLFHRKTSAHAGTRALVHLQTGIPSQWSCAGQAQFPSIGLPCSASNLDSLAHTKEAIAGLVFFHLLHEGRMSEAVEIPF